MMRMIRSMVTFAKVSLFLLNLYVAAVVLVVVMGQWKIFESQDPNRQYDDSHLIVMRELKEEDAKLVLTKNVSKVEIPSPPEQKFKEEGVVPAFTSERLDRVDTMRHWCDKLKPNRAEADTIPVDKLNQILVDDNHKLLYCQIPGVGQTDWRRILIFLSGQVKVQSHLKISGGDVHSKYAKHLKKISDFTPEERARRIKEYYKVMFVREPFERLVSSFKSKFEAKYSKYFHQAFGKKIIKKYRKNPSKDSLAKGNDVTFAEFVKFVIDSEHAEELLNEHWLQFYKQCHPCLVSYDFVGKYETLDDDMMYVLRKVDAASKITAPLGTTNFTYPENTLRTLYKTVPVSYLRKLWKMYYPDYTLFSYQYPDLLKEILEKSKIYTDY